MKYFVARISISNLNLLKRKLSWQPQFQMGDEKCSKLDNFEAFQMPQSNQNVDVS